MLASSHPSAVRVFGKSLYTFSAGWTLSIAWLCVAEAQQHRLRHGTVPPDLSIDTVVSGVIPAIAIAGAGFLLTRWTGPAPAPALERREWWHAFWWSLVPNLLLLVTVWLMIDEAR